VDPVPDPLVLRKSGSAGNRTRASGSVGGRESSPPPTLVFSFINISTLMNMGFEMFE
jgi:hypothetical protein